MYNLDINDPNIDKKLKDKKIVIPKSDSRLYQYAKNSEAMEKWIVGNYDKIKNGESYDDKIEFPLKGFDMLRPSKRSMYTTIHNANIRNAKVNPDGSFSAQTDDPYNFEKWNLWPKRDNLKEYSKNVIRLPYAIINNAAKSQQNANQLENIFLSIPINFTQEDIEKIKRKYSKRNEH